MPRKSTKTVSEISEVIPEVKQEVIKPETVKAAPKKAVVRKPVEKKTVPVEEATDGKFVSMNTPVVAVKSEPVVEEKSRVSIVKPVTAPPVTTPLVAPSAPRPQTSYGQQTNRVGFNNNNRGQYTNNRPSQNRPAQSRVAMAPSYAESNAPSEPIVGVLDIGNDGAGYVRPKFTPSSKDAYIASNQLKRLGLRAGDMIVGAVRVARESEKYGMITRIDRVNDLELAAVQKRPNFGDLVPIYAQKQAKLETDSQILSTRIIDLFSPIGFGQRGMIVSPPKAGKTTLLKEIAAGVAINYPNVHLMAVLVGERPEEVTDMQRFVKGEVIASSFDQKPEEQTKAAEIAIERAKRLVEMGKDVFVVFDSITRLARAYNLAIPSSGRTLSGGFDPAALYPSKKFFGAARNIEDGGSLTIVGTALVDTGSKMDELVFEEFKGTGNMELHLTRSLAERRIFPAFNILRSGTRKEEFLLDPAILTKMTAVRRMFDNIEDKEEATIMVMEQMMKTKNNDEFMKKIGKN